MARAAFRQRIVAIARCGFQLQRLLVNFHDHAIGLAGFVGYRCRGVAAGFGPHGVKYQSEFAIHHPDGCIGHRVRHLQRFDLCGRQSARSPRRAGWVAEILNVRHGNVCQLAIQLPHRYVVAVHVGAVRERKQRMVLRVIDEQVMHADTWHRRGRPFMQRAELRWHRAVLSGQHFYTTQPVDASHGGVIVRVPCFGGTIGRAAIQRLQQVVLILGKFVADARFW